MAAAGMRVITNTYRNKDLSKLHDNIESFDIFNEKLVAEQLKSTAEKVLLQVNDPMSTQRARCDWFFDGKSNLSHVFRYAQKRIIEFENYVGSE